MFKICKKCNKNKNLDNFYSKKKNPDGHQSWCKQCSRNYQLSWRYGVSDEDYSKLLIKQNGLCAICKTPNAGDRINFFHVDHDHKTGKVRGLLCNNCNGGIAYLQEDLKILQSALEYLKND
jgi:hypothetical protein